MSDEAEFLQIKSNALFLNQDVSWLAFNNRVLQESFDKRHPLLERLKFLSITGNNLDEFYRVRVSRIKHMLSHEHDSHKKNFSKKLYQQVIGMTQSLLKEQAASLENLRVELLEENIRIILHQEELVTLPEALVLEAFKKIHPFLTPYGIDSVHPFPFIPNQSLAFISHLESKQDQKEKMALVSMPTNFPRFICLNDQTNLIVSVDALIHRHVDLIFPESRVLDFGVFRYLRAADVSAAEMDIEEDEAFREVFEKMLKQRRFGEGVQLQVSLSMHKTMKSFLIHHLHVPFDLVFESHFFIGPADLNELSNLPLSHLHYPPFKPRNRSVRASAMMTIFDHLDKEEILIHHPYESFESIVTLLRSAAKDPHVTVIKQTLYRVGPHSPIVEALIESVNAGKTVVVLIELKARFDEELNMKWAQMMKDAGIQVFYGVEGLKTHAKMTLILRQDPLSGQMKSYTHIGTGNYNANTAKFYTDISYLTSNAEIGQDVIAIFNGLTASVIPQNLRQVILSPYGLRSKILSLIDREIAFSQSGRRGQIWAKMNALVDHEIINKLYQASQAGVDIELIVRGICCLKPGIPGLSDKIRVKSIIGRFLEHARIFCFANGANLPSKKTDVYIASADWMPRNLDRRIEVMVPILDQKLKSVLVGHIMKANIKDTVNSWVLDHNGRYIRLQSSQQNLFDAQAFLLHDMDMQEACAVI